MLVVPVFNRKSESKDAGLSLGIIHLEMHLNISSSQNSLLHFPLNYSQIRSSLRRSSPRSLLVVWVEVP